MSFLFGSLSALLCFAVLATSALASPPELVTVGDADNASDVTGYGAIPYEYKIGKFEVTNEEYCEFLSAVAKSDPHGLYDSRMDEWNPDADRWGGIERSGSPGSYTYALISGCGKRPVNFVTWESAARFCNWLSGGETETGVYALKDGLGRLKLPRHSELAGGEKASWAISSEDEWYKAAYFDPKKGGKAGYWRFPGRSDSAHDANLNTHTPSEVGKAGPASAYGTFDQGGNLWEYLESRYGDQVGLRGGSFFLNDNPGYMESTTRYDVYTAKWPNYGFRVVRLGGK